MIFWTRTGNETVIKIPIFCIELRFGSSCTCMVETFLNHKDSDQKSKLARSTVQTENLKLVLTLYITLYIVWLEQNLTFTYSTVYHSNTGMHSISTENLQNFAGLKSQLSLNLCHNEWTCILDLKCMVCCKSFSIPTYIHSYSGLTSYLNPTPQTKKSTFDFIQWKYVWNARMVVHTCHTMYIPWHLVWTQIVLGWAHICS